MTTIHYPKVLIFSQVFNDFSGGGITLTNLFKGYPIENLAVLTYPFMLVNVSFDTCDKYYQIGREEYRWRYPLSRIKKTYDSGLVRNKTGDLQVPKFTSSLRNRLSSGILVPLLRCSGLTHCASEIILSEKLMIWLKDYNPGILYLQISNRESIIFSLRLMDFLKIPVIIHMMDDWPSSVSNTGLKKYYWRRKIDSEFRKLLNKTDLCLSISEAMSEEYLNRYSRKFIPFHNPINPERFNQLQQTANSAPKNLKILYLGRIGIANQSSLLTFARFISEFRHNEHNTYLDIYTKDTENPIARKIEKLPGVQVREAIGHDEVPKLMQEYDLLLLPLDFTVSGLRFSRLSMPTKATEYMMSGVPIIVFAPSETAVSRFCTVHACGYCITSPNVKDIAEIFTHIIDDFQNRRDLGERARKLAQQLFDCEKVRSKFWNLLIAMGDSHFMERKYIETSYTSFSDFTG